MGILERRSTPVKKCQSSFEIVYGYEIRTLLPTITNNNNNNNNDRLFTAKTVDDNLYVLSLRSF